MNQRQPQVQLMEHEPVGIRMSWEEARCEGRVQFTPNVCYVLKPIGVKQFQSKLNRSCFSCSSSTFFTSLFTGMRSYYV